MTNRSSSSLRYIHIIRKKKYRKSKQVSLRKSSEQRGNYKWGNFSSSSFHILQHSENKNHRALFCFSSSIDENTDTIHLIEGFVF